MVEATDPEVTKTKPQKDEYYNARVYIGEYYK